MCLFSGCDGLFKKKKSLRSSKILEVKTQDGEVFLMIIPCMRVESKWKRIQIRRNNKLEFNQTMESYINGFGSLKYGDNYWIGLDEIHKLSKLGTKLQIYIENENGNTGAVIYENFKVSDVCSDFLMTFDTYHGDIDGGLNNCTKFIVVPGNGDIISGGWWGTKESMAVTNLNGRYEDGIRYKNFLTDEDKVSKIIIMILLN